MNRPSFVLVALVFACAQVQVEPTVIPTTASPITTATPTTTFAPATTLAPTTTAPEKGWLVIHGVGDVNLDPSYIPALANHGYEWAWSGLDGFFLGDDVTVVNLECSPSSLGAAEPKDFTFQCPDGKQEMVAAGIDVTNLGNNHSQDFGEEAMLDGRHLLESAGLNPVGAGSDVAEASDFARFEVAGWKVAVLGFGGIRPHDGWIATETEPGMADGDSIEIMTSAVAAADEWADWTVVAVHWGVELDREPRPEDVDRAHAMIEAGADAIFGHHSHRLQPFEVVGNRPVFWSLGNFVWPNSSTAGSESAVGRVVVSPAGEITGCLLPASIESAGHPVLTGAKKCGVEP